MLSLPKYFSNLKLIFKKFYTEQNLPKLHRWCTIVSPIYKNSCNWEKKMELAAKDNCFKNYNKSPSLKDEILIDPITNEITFFRH